MYTKNVISTLAVTGLVLALAVPMNAEAKSKKDHPPHSTFQASNFHDFPGSTIPQASAGTLIRTKKDVRGQFAMSDLHPDAAHTMWWVVWNDPGVCATNPCGLDDLGAPGNSVFNATGFLTGADGTANISVYMDDHELPEGLDAPIPGGLDKHNGFGAELHLLVESHGAITAGEVDIQISKDGGACKILDPIPPHDDICVIYQGIFFLPID